MPELLECFAVATPGVEPVTARELAAMGVTEAVAEPGGVTFRAAPERLWEANLRLRTASRVLVRIARFRARTFFELERHADKVPWLDWMASGALPEFEVTSKKSRLYHQKGIAARLAQAVARRRGAGWVPAATEPPQRFVVRVARDEFTVSADASGELLHRRGYRLDTAKAPLRETLAAALLLASEWTPDRPLLDPFCGSGTIPIEAALMARRIAPGLARAFAFERWPGFDAAAWRALRARVAAEILPAAPAPIVGSDRDAGAIAASRQNAERAGVAADIAFHEAPLSAMTPPGERGWLVTNPPYGVRIGEEAALRDLFATLGRLARQRLDGWHLVMLSANPRLEGATRLAWVESFHASNGGIPVRALLHRPD